MDQIFDPIRKKYVALTPEERVRQHVIRVFTRCHGYPETHLAVEYAFKFNKLQYRADIVVFNNLGEPQMIVECKAESVPITEKVLDQAIRYYSGLKVKYLTLTNGKTMFCYKVENGKLEAITEFPF